MQEAIYGPFEKHGIILNYRFGEIRDVLSLISGPV